MSYDLDHDRHTLVGKDSYGRVWKLHILLNRGITVESLYLNDQSLDFCMAIAGPQETETSPPGEALLSFQEAHWQPGMGNGKIFAYCQSESWPSPFKYAIEVKCDFWVTPQGLRIQLSYQGDKNLNMGWLIQKKNQETFCIFMDSKKSKLTWEKNLSEIQGHYTLEAIDSKNTFDPQTSSFKKTLELLLSFHSLKNEDLA